MIDFLNLLTLKRPCCDGTRRRGDFLIFLSGERGEKFLFHLVFFCFVVLASLLCFLYVVVPSVM